MRQNDFNPTANEAANAATLKVVLNAVKDMRAKTKAKRKLRLIATGVDSKSLVWGEFGVCNADDTHRTYLVFDIAGHTRGATPYVTARELHDALFGGPYAKAVIMHLMCAMHWAGDVEKVGERPRNRGMREANLNVVGRLLADAVPFIQALRRQGAEDGLAALAGQSNSATVFVSTAPSPARQDHGPRFRRARSSSTSARG